MDIEANAESKKNVDQVRIKVSHEGTQGIVMLAVDGWEYGTLGDDTLKGNRWHPNGSRGKQVRLSLNGPLRMTIDEWRQLRDSIDSSWEEFVG